MLGVVGMLLNGSARPRKPSTTRRANGVLRKNFGQRIRELLIKYRYVGVGGHVFAAFPEALDET